MGKLFNRSCALKLWFVALFAQAACADVDRTNPYDINAPVAIQMVGQVQASVEAIPVSDPNAPTTPVEGATVLLLGPRNSLGTTDADGSAIINNLTPGNYNVVVSARGYYDNVTRAVIKPGQEVSVQLTLRVAPQTGNEAQYGNIFGVVIKSDQVGQVPADNSGIAVTTVDAGKKQVTTVTDVNGEFSLRVLPGPHTVQFSADGYAPATFTNIYVSAGGATAACEGAAILQKL